MKKSKIRLPELYLVGITTQTNNAAEASPATAKIGPIVQRYFQNNSAETITNRKNPGVTYSIYTDYESDYTGNYTYFIGEEVTTFDSVDKHLKCLTIPAQQYIKFTTKPGPMPHVVINAWQKIWNMSEDELGGKRAYVADFEIYDHRAQDPNNAIVDIYIGIQ